MIGFSFSPGGLLFPYHLGVISSLVKTGHLTPHTPIAGSSAGAIAVASHAAGVSPHDALEGCVRMCEDCNGIAQGRLMPLLERELEELLPQNAHEIVRERPGFTGLAYKEIFPIPKNVLSSEFDSREDLKEAVCNSSMFPFFTSPWPCLIRPPSPNGNTNEDRGEMNLGTGYSSMLSNVLPRFIVDGYFTVPRERFGCPVIDEYTTRTVTVSVIPHDIINLTVSSQCDQISPKLRGNSAEENADDLKNLFQAAVSPSSREDLFSLFDRGQADAEEWSIKHGS